jgi:hypothetical protein
MKKNMVILLFVLFFGIGTNVYAGGCNVEALNVMFERAHQLGYSNYGQLEYKIYTAHLPYYPKIINDFKPVTAYVVYQAYCQGQLSIKEIAALKTKIEKCESRYEPKGQDLTKMKVQFLESRNAIRNCIIN